MNRRAVLFTALIITCMTAASEGLREPEVIFPEIAAIATGALLAPRLVWKVNKKRIFGYIMLCAVLGMAIVRYCPFTLTVNFLYFLTLKLKIAVIPLRNLPFRRGILLFLHKTLDLLQSPEAVPFAAIPSAF